MSIDLIANLSYIVAAILFIFGLKMLGHPNTARRGNGFSALGMFIAVVAGYYCWVYHRYPCSATGCDDSDA
jgi:NAD/NADP transhydrogenase beta subunit